MYVGESFLYGSAGGKGFCKRLQDASQQTQSSTMCSEDTKLLVDV